MIGSNVADTGAAALRALAGGFRVSRALHVAALLDLAGQVSAGRTSVARMAEALPQVSRLGVLVLEGAPLRARHDAALRQAAVVLGQELLIFPTRERVELALPDRADEVIE